MTATAELPIVHTLSGLAYRREQEAGDVIACRRCGDPLPDTNPDIIEHDAEGYAWHDTCWVEAGMHQVAAVDGDTHEFRRSTEAAWKCAICGVSRQSKAHGWTKPKGTRGTRPRRNTAPASMPVAVGEWVDTVDLKAGDRVTTTMGVAFDFGIPVVRPHSGKARDGEVIVRTVRSSLREAGGHVVRFEENKAKSAVIRGTTRWQRAVDRVDA